MIPTIDLRLASMIRAMSEVIAPAIDQSNSIACEQAALMIGQLRMLADQLNRNTAYAIECYEDLRETATLFQKPAGGMETMAAAENWDAAVSNPVAWDTAEADYLHANQALENLVRATERDGDPAFVRAVRQAALDHSVRQATRDSSWFRMSGYYGSSDSE